MVRFWWLWGLGWLFMPRMTIGLLLYIILKLEPIGLTLAIIGGLLDIISKSE